jgi:NAD(P)-dependent dehydrogenase (short-subunit alcohol dehydrogenase family)
MGLLDGRTAIVTGASSGIGRAIALRFAAEGARLALADLREQPIEGGETTVLIQSQAAKPSPSIPTCRAGRI